MMVWLVYPLTTIVPNYSAFRKRNRSGTVSKHTLRLFEIARVLVRLYHVASFIVNANRGVPVNGCCEAKKRN